MNAAISALRAENFRFEARATTVPLRFHIIQDGSHGSLSDRQLGAQVTLLNKIFQTSQLRFEILDVDRRHNRTWFYKAAPGSDVEAEMKRKLGKDTARSLNIYTCLPAGYLGYATSPVDLEEWPDLDGVVLHHATVPESGNPGLSVSARPPFMRSGTGVASFTPLTTVARLQATKSMIRPTKGRQPKGACLLKDLLAQASGVLDPSKIILTIPTTGA
jgi:hypothetical protein